MMKNERIGAEFFSCHADELAVRLLGKRLCRRTENGMISAEICETECYMGEDDTACHAHRGKTMRNSVLYECGGTVYVYLCYGMHNLLNIVAGARDYPEAVLVRGVIIDGKTVSGPGRVTKALSVDRQLNRADIALSDGLWLQQGREAEYTATPRIGIDYAERADRERLWRFVAVQ